MVWRGEPFLPRRVLPSKVFPTPPAKRLAKHIDRLKNGPYPYPLKRRILGDGGHLSNEACASFADYLASEGATSLLLAHISEVNNSPELALAVCESTLCASHRDVAIDAAHPDEPVLLQVD